MEVNPHSSDPAPAGEAEPTCAAWMRRTPAERRAALRRAAAAAHALWRAGAELRGIPPDALLAPPPPGDAAPVRRPLPHHALIGVLTGWNRAVEGWLPAADRRRFLHAFLRCAGAGPGVFRHTLAELEARGRRADAAGIAALFRHELGGGLRRARAGADRLAGRWDPDPERTVGQLAAQLLAAETAPDTVRLKEGPGGAVFRARLDGRDVLVKRFELPNRRARLKYALRRSRAARAWASARVLTALGIGTPEPLGRLEVRRGGLPLRSWFVTAYEEDTLDLRRWVETGYAAWSPERRAAVARELRDFLLSFYGRAIHHPDTKASNILVRHPEDDARRELLAIDLECVGCRPLRGRRPIVRNLVQLNGSLAHAVPRAECCAFLRLLAPHLPWIVRPEAIRAIDSWTGRRLEKERRRQCGH